METWICVDAALPSADFVANVRYHVALGRSGKITLGAKRKSRDFKMAADFYLVHVTTVGTVSTETCWAWATVPGSIWRAVALHSSKARVGQAAVCIRVT